MHNKYAHTVTLATTRHKKMHLMSEPLLFTVGVLKLEALNCTLWTKHIKSHRIPASHMSTESTNDDGQMIRFIHKTRALVHSRATLQSTRQNYNCKIECAILMRAHWNTWTQNPWCTKRNRNTETFANQNPITRKCTHLLSTRKWWALKGQHERLRNQKEVNAKVVHGSKRAWTIIQLNGDSTERISEHQMDTNTKTANQQTWSKAQAQKTNWSMRRRNRTFHKWKHTWPCWK